MIDTIYILGAFVISLVLSHKIRWYCVEKGMINAVSKRSSHKTPTARGGGLSIVLITIVFGLPAIYFLQLPYAEFLYILLGCVALVAYMGWLDDTQPRSATLRFAVQTLAVGLCLYFLPQIFDFVPLWLEKIVLLFAWVWFVNLYNFMDGIDGLASFQAVFLAVSISFFFVELKPLVLVLAGTIIGFMRLNWHPAKIFLGDVGSTFLGFILGGFLFLTLANISADANNNGDIINSAFSLLTITLLFTGDATYTLIKRILQGKTPWQAHREHWYQRATLAGLSHAQVTLRAMAINLILLIIAAIGMIAKLGPITLILGLVLLAIVAYRIRWIEGK